MKYTLFFGYAKKMADRVQMSGTPFRRIEKRV